MVRSVSAAACVALAAVTFAPAHAQAEAAIEKRELTPADAIATTRIIENQLTLGERVETGATSPDGKRYLLRLVHGDVERNGDWMDLLTGSLESLDAAVRPRACAHLFTTGLGSTRLEALGDADPTSTNLIHWVNNTQIAFLWNDANGIHQVMSVDMLSCRHRFLTHSATDVGSFIFASDGSLLFDALIPRSAGASQRLWRKGLTVNDSSDGWSILKGDITGGQANSIFDNVWFIRSANSTRAIDIVGKSIDHTNPLFREIFPSSNRRLAVIDVGVDGVPAGWQRYTNASLQSLLNVDRSVLDRLPLTYALVDLKTGASRLLWDAPRAVRGQVAWSPNSETLLLAPAFLPLAADSPLGLSGGAAAELDVRSGKYKILPVDLSLRTVVNTEWLSADMVEIRSINDLGLDNRVDRLVREADRWRVATTTESRPATPPAIHLETRQSLNRPPQVFAVDSASGQSRLVLDPNPHLLEDFKLGRVERMSGVLSNGKQWVGQLMYPADYKSGSRYPLVIQSYYGHALGEEDFSFDGTWGFPGMGLGPSSYAAYPGQLLATRNIAVLTLLIPRFSPGSGQDDDYQLAYESLAKQFIASGLADPDKIGLSGFSRNGHWVEFALAHSPFPFAAAIAADNYDPSYFQAALVNWRAQEATMNGAPAFGDGLQKWLARAVGFNAEHIRTPLFMIGQSGSTEMIIGQWEIFSRLKHLRKPVEMYMMPEVDIHPSHIPQNPGQILAIQDHAIDWLSFWLTGREDPSPDKREQFARWHAFRAGQTVAGLQDAKAP